MTEDELLDLAEDVDTTARVNPTAILIYHPELSSLSYDDKVWLVHCALREPDAQQAVRDLLRDRT